MHHVLLFLPLLAIGLFFFFSWQVALPLYVLILVISAIGYWKGVQAQRQPPIMGRKVMVGERAVVIGAGREEMEVSDRGEMWNAVSPQSLHTGQEVVIEKVEGLPLQVTPIPQPPGLKGENSE
jgi:membrane protein implicated in regulation of membrane protease activity